MPYNAAMRTEKQHLLFEKRSLLMAAFLLVLSYFTVVHNFWSPAALFWDENYHIASAQKYMNGVYFMEPHPPLGKLVVAAGEWLLDFNERDDQFIGTDYARNPPEGFVFAGYRLFPTLLAWLSVPVFFWIFLLLTGRRSWAALFSFLLIFDNAFLVHSRSAMLDSTMLFFCLLLILFFLLLSNTSRKSIAWLAVGFGASFAAALTTKVFSLLFVLLFPLLLWRMWPRWKKFGRFCLFAAAGFVPVYVGVWYAHFAIGQNIQTGLPDKGYYQASEEYKAILDEGRTTSPLAFPTMLSDSLAFVSHYQKGVPELNLCKEDENGSPFFFWPLGAQSISYRWSTPNGRDYQYLFLQVNPVVWWLGVLGLLLTFVILLGRALLPVQGSMDPNRRFYLLSFAFLYVGFMGAISQIDRVMYLYHYFLPLFFSFFLLALCFMELDRIGSWKMRDEQKTSMLFVMGALIVMSFSFYRPLTYYEPLSDEQFQRRAFFPLWELTCVKCDRDSLFATPIK